MRKLVFGAAALVALLLAFVLLTHIHIFPQLKSGVPGVGSSSGPGAASSTSSGGSGPVASQVPGRDVSLSALRGLWVTALAYDGQDNLWVGTEDTGLYFVSADRLLCRQMATHEGLGDMSVYAVAVDAAGRVWAGHRANGVSVLEGGVWKNYNIVSGPLGHRVFDIAANPRDGDVWMATDCGLTHYVAASATWQHHTTLNGLPSNATYRVAVADDDTVIVGMQADGLAVARSSDGYKQWRHLDGPIQAPLASTGEGLPSCQINDIATRDDSLWVATPFGLAHAQLSDLAFTFWRGVDWEDKAQLLRTHPTIPLEQQVPGVLREDYVARVKLLPGRKLAIGYRRQGSQTIATEQLLSGEGAQSITAQAWGAPIAAMSLNSAGQLLIGTYGQGVTLPPIVTVASAAARLTSAPPVRPAQPPAAAELEAMVQSTPQVAGDGSVAAFLGDDWAIQGDTVNHYGRQFSCRPWAGSSTWLPAYKANVRTGIPTESVWTYFDDISQNDRRHWFNIMDGKRIQGEWNDGSWQAEKYPPGSDGPDLWFDVSVPAGVHRVSLLFINNDAHSGPNSDRDFLLEVKPFRDSTAEADALPTLCRARVVSFYMPVIKQFALSGGHYYIKVARQYSHVTKCSALFIDRLNGAPSQPESGFAPFMDSCKEYVPQAIPGEANDPSPTARLCLAWRTTARDCLSNAAASSLLARRVQLYRAASAGGVPEPLLSAMRWEMPYVTEQDRQQFDRAMAGAFDRHLDQYPMTLTGVFWNELSKQSQPWYRFKQTQGQRPAQFDLTAASLDGTADQIKAALARHLACRGQDLFSSRSGGMTDENPIQILKGFTNHGGNEYLRLGELVGLGESHLMRDKPAKQRVGLAICIASVHLALDQLHDAPAAQAIFEAFILPHAAIASGAATDNPLSVSALSSLAEQVYPPDQRAAIRQKLAHAAK